MPRPLSSLARARWACVAGAVVAALAVQAGCSDGSNLPTPASVTSATASSGKSSSTTGAGGGGGHGGAGGHGGGASPNEVCVVAPQPSPFAGTDDCPAPLPAARDALDDALSKGGIDRCHVRLLPADVSLSGELPRQIFDIHRLPGYSALQRGPLRLPGYARETRDWLDAAIASPHPVSGTIAALSARRGLAFPRVCADLSAFEPAGTDPTPLATAVLLLDQNQGAPGDQAAVQAAAAPIPLALQRKLALVVGAIDHAATEVKAALGTTDPKIVAYLAGAHALYAPSVSGWSTAGADLLLLDKVDLDRMAEAAALLARTIEDADFAAEPDATFAAFEVATPLGHVLVHDSSDDTYPKSIERSMAALLFDLGGNDTYDVPAGASDATHPVSIAIDVRGADRYQYEENADPLDAGLLPSDGAGRYSSSLPPTMDDGPITLSRVGRQGVGLAGIGMLFDLGKEGDHYRSLAISQGFAAVGVGVLYDAGGDDTYEAEIASQGVATFGIGALIDRSGHDTYKAFNISQGFGGAEGAGALVDGAGDDTYFIDPGTPETGSHLLYFSPQLPGKANGSMSQGAAQGRIPQNVANDGNMAGGLGILRDVSGKDHYTGGVFAQGVAYWQGLGMLLEGGGDDVYDALWYIQGSTAHVALSVFLEQGGDDTYNLEVQPAATSIGVGHDYSASLHLDEGGNDRYNAPGLSLGSGNINGIGLLINVGGDDQYVAAGDPTLGAGNYSAEAPYGLMRQKSPTIGVFVDAGGTNTYSVAGVMRPLAGTTWSYDPQPYPKPELVTSEFGCGADAPQGTVVLP